jgi:hypothetical protein
MPFMKPYIADDGGEHPECYWALVQINIGIADYNALATYYGYHDINYWKDGKPSINGAQKTYNISGDELKLLMAKHLTPGGPNILVLVDEVALNKKDTLSPTNDEPERKVSFFNPEKAQRFNVVVTQSGLTIVPFE